MIRNVFILLFFLLSFKAIADVERKVTNVKDKKIISDFFYSPVLYKINNIPIIIYPVKGQEPLEKVFDPKNINSLYLYLEDLYKKEQFNDEYEGYDHFVTKGIFHIVFLRNKEGKRETEVWFYESQNWDKRKGFWDFTFFIEFDKNMDLFMNQNSIQVLGREEKIRRLSLNLEEYLSKNRPKLILDLSNDLVSKNSFFEREGK